MMVLQWPCLHVSEEQERGETRNYGNSRMLSLAKLTFNMLPGKLPSAGLTHSDDLAKASWPGAKERLPLATVHFNGRRNGNAKLCLQGLRESRSGSVECWANLTISSALMMVTEPSMRLMHVQARSRASRLVACLE
jgi:hypothetical protein